MPVVDPAPVNVAAAGSLLPEQPASARAPAARTATLDKPRFIEISIQCLVHQGRSGTLKSCTSHARRCGSARGRETDCRPIFQPTTSWVVQATLNVRCGCRVDKSALPACYQWEKLAEVCLGLSAERVSIDGVDAVAADIAETPAASVRGSTEQAGETVTGQPPARSRSYRRGAASAQR
jgi:hypothetical protein